MDDELECPYCGCLLDDDICPICFYHVEVEESTEDEGLD